MSRNTVSESQPDSASYQIPIGPGSLEWSKTKTVLSIIIFRAHSLLKLLLYEICYLSDIQSTGLFLVCLVLKQSYRWRTGRKPLIEYLMLIKPSPQNQLKEK